MVVGKEARGRVFVLLEWFISAKKAGDLVYCVEAEDLEMGEESEKVGDVIEDKGRSDEVADGVDKDGKGWSGCGGNKGHDISFDVV